MKESRLFRIVYYLLQHGKTTARELADQFEVSIRTIYRDLDEISSAGIPIYANTGRYGGIVIDETYVLSKTLLSEHEQQDILNALQSLQAVDSTLQHNAYNKLQSLFQVEPQDWIGIDFSQWYKKDSDSFSLIKEAILNKVEIEFTYYNSQKDKTKRRAQPHKLWYKSNQWYLQAYCLLKQEFRMFKLKRIDTLQVHEQSFELKPLPPLDIQTKPPLINLKLKCDSSLKYRLYDEFETTQFVNKEDGYLYIEVSLPDESWLVYYLMSFGSHLEVLEPQRIRQKLINELEDIKSLYVE